MLYLVSVLQRWEGNLERIGKKTLFLEMKKNLFLKMGVAALHL